MLLRIMMLLVIKNLYLTMEETLLLFGLTFGNLTGQVEGKFVSIKGLKLYPVLALAIEQMFKVYHTFGM